MSHLFSLTDGNKQFSITDKLVWTYELSTYQKRPSTVSFYLLMVSITGKNFFKTLIHQFIWGIRQLAVSRTNIISFLVGFQFNLNQI